MMFQGDLIIKTAIELALDDMRKQPWLIEDCFRTLIENPYLKEKYGMKEINRAKEWFLSNEVHVYLRERLDKQEFPCVTISVSSGNEAEELATLGDLDTCVEEYTSKQLGKPIPYIVPPFNAISYDKATGIVEMPLDIEEWSYINEGMIVIDVQTGEGFVVLGKAGDHGFSVAPDTNLPKGKLAIIPKFCIWKARRESIESKYNFNIGCHAHGDPAYLIFLFDIVKYGLLRYRESLLEANGYQLSTLNFTDLIKNKNFGEENVYSRWIGIKGQVNESWVKGPKRVIEAIALEDEDGNTGIRVGAGTAPDFLDPKCEPWLSVDPDDEE